MNLGADPSRDVPTKLWDSLLWEFRRYVFPKHRPWKSIPATIVGKATQLLTSLDMLSQITAKQPWTKRKKGRKGLKMIVSFLCVCVFFLKAICFRFHRTRVRVDGHHFVVTMIRRRCPGRRWVRWPSQIRLQRSRIRKKSLTDLSVQRLPGGLGYFCLIISPRQVCFIFKVIHWWFQRKYKQLGDSLAT